jgi:Uma2 family endonuclease
MKAKAAVRVPTPTVLRGVLYHEYVKLRDEPANGHLRMTYHDGVLEIMSPESRHEIPSRRFGLIVFVLAEELDIAYQGTSSTTFRRGVVGLKKGNGKEPDESFYFAHAMEILGKHPIDLDRDPPPDLWIEVDNRASSRGRLPVYAALGVPEVWRYRVATGRLWFGRLVDGGIYEPIERSLCLPMLTPSLVREALALGAGVLESTWARRLRAWVRERFGPEGGGAGHEQP